MKGIAKEHVWVTTKLSYDRHDHIVSFNYLNDQCDFCMETNPSISTAKQPEVFQYDEDM